MSEQKTGAGVLLCTVYQLVHFEPAFLRLTDSYNFKLVYTSVKGCCAVRCACVVYVCPVHTPVI